MRMYLPHQTITYRSHPNETTRKTPNLLNFGWESALLFNPTRQEQENLSEYVTCLSDRLGMAQVAVRVNSATAMVTEAPV